MESLLWKKYDKKDNTDEFLDCVKQLWYNAKSYFLKNPAPLPWPKFLPQVNISYLALTMAA